MFFAWFLGDRKQMDPAVFFGMLQLGCAVMLQDTTEFFSAE